MCGIVGLFLKDQALQPKLGAMVSPMLIGMGDRGPDSAGLALYRDPVPPGSTKMTLRRAHGSQSWENLITELEAGLGISVSGKEFDDHLLLRGATDAGTMRDWLKENRPDIRVVGAGQQIELFKKAGRPEDIVAAMQFILTCKAFTGQMLAIDGGQHLIWQTPDLMGIDGRAGP